MDIPAEQHEVAEFLARLTDEGVVETHISLVFLGRDEALKLKKAVDLGFLNFTRLEDRARLTRHEHALNAPNAPGLYLGAVAVTRGADGALALGGEGAVVDWVLRMRRLPPEAFLDVGAEPDASLLDSLADTVAALHEAAPRRAGDGAMDAVLAGNRTSGVAAGLPAGEVEAWHARATAVHAGLRPWLAERAAAGFLRRCHGDLHLGNLCLMDGRPYAFDALEFNEELATIDVGYDLAFLLMDLEQRHGRPAANQVLNRHVARLGDAGLVRGLPLWLSLRAFIRAHVAARRGGAEAGGLLRAALAYLGPLPPARLVAVGGLQGTGKSRLARQLAPALGAAPGALILRSDETRKRRAGVPPETRLPEAAYTPAENAAVFVDMLDLARTALAAGHAVLLDAVFQREAERAALADLHPDFTGLWLTAPLDVLRARVANRRGDASDASPTVLEATAARDMGAIGWHVLDATHDAAPQARKVLDLPARPSP